MPFLKGNPGGPGSPGSKRHRFITQNLVSLLQEVDPEDVPKVRRLANALLNKALEGDVTAIKEVIDRVEGKVPQPIAGDPDNPLTITSVVHEIVRVAENQRSNPPLIDARDPKAA